MPSCFQKLAELDVLPADLAQRFAQIARFGELLLFRYWAVEDVQVYQILQEGINDWDAFTESVQRFMQREYYA